MIAPVAQPRDWAIGPRMHQLKRAPASNELPTRGPIRSPAPVMRGLINKEIPHAPIAPIAPMRFGS